MNRKLMQIIFAAIIALVFISSYISLVNYNSQQSTTTTTGQTYYAQGFANATVAGYEGPMYFILAGSAASNATASNIINSNLTALEDNNSVSNFYASDGNFSVEPGNMSAYQIYNFIFSKLNATVAANATSSNAVSSNQVSRNPYNTTAYALATLRLPEIVNFTIGSQSAILSIPQQYINESVQLPIKYPIGSHLKVKVSTLVEANGTISGQMNVVVV